MDFAEIAPNSTRRVVAATSLECNVSRIIPLSLMESGESGTVFDLTGSPEFVHRLEEMGLCSGASIRLLHGGEPCLIAIGEHRLSLRCDDESAVILVEVCDDATSLRGGLPS